MHRLIETSPRKAFKVLPPPMKKALIKDLHITRMSRRSAHKNFYMDTRFTHRYILYNGCNSGTD
jgi:hypothetical protein